MLRYSRLIEATYAGDYRVNLKFSDGVAGCVDLSDQLWGYYHEPLKDKQLFSQLRIDPEVAALVWPNGADMAPEIIYERALQAAGKNK
ncbi:MAG: DUF2442 domain-containing protein [Alphaproteobacteria bacterium]|nr:DUF2442 domain-containing protein [Alphaproteobacteria bacterium]